jgi:hypothetical protein
MEIDNNVKRSQLKKLVRERYEGEDHDWILSLI